MEKDIFDTMEEMSKQYLNMEHAQARIVFTYGRHDDLYAKVNALPTTVQKRSDQISEVDLRYILKMQLDYSPAKINVGEIFKMLAPDTRVKVL